MAAAKEKAQRPDADRDARAAPSTSTDSTEADFLALLASQSNAPAATSGAYDKTALFAALFGKRGAEAIRAAAADPAQAMADLRKGQPNESFDDADFLSPNAPDFSNPEADVEAFFDLVKSSKPYSAITRAQLDVIFRAISFDDQKRLIQAQFNIVLAGIGGAEFTQKELDDLYEQARALPPAHDEGNPSFVTLERSKDAVAEGSYGTKTVIMDAEKDPARYSAVLRHEIGHAVDDRLGGTSAHLRTDEAGWMQHATADDWIAGLGGFGDLPASLQDAVRGAVVAYFGKGNTFNAPTATFEETLVAQLASARGKPPTDPDVASDMTTLRALYGTNMLLRTCIASQGNNNYFRFQGWPAANGRVFFINHYYAKGYSLIEATHASLKAWGNAAAAFSDKEWFAEVYAEWYRNGIGGKHFEFPGFVTQFFQSVVETMGAADANAGKGDTSSGGDSNGGLNPGSAASGYPRVPRG